ncbi:MAG: hypothetical protein M3280_02520 [Actinomycetota bacterium]|nr:hypothetical protein [Actinomycetota bacterium]
MEAISEKVQRDPLSDIQDRLRPRVMRERALDELEELFRAGRAPDPQPDGFLPGRVVTMSVTRPTDSFVRWVTSLYMPWLGKAFDRASDSGINVLTPSSRSQLKVVWPSYEPQDSAEGNLEAFPFKTRVAPGEVDPGVDVLKIDYDFEENPSFIIRRILDELVQIDDGFYLGKILFRRKNSWHRIGFFSLRSV